jgi:hypothetical protein
MRILSLSLASAFVLMLSAAATAQPAKLDPCGLLTQAEIKAATGMEIGKLAIDATMNPASGNLCAFQVGEVGAGGVALRTMATGETPQKMIAENQKYKIKTSEASGFGAGAFFGVGDFGVVQLNAFKGSTHVIVQLMIMTWPEAKTKEALGKLMTTAIARVK